MTTAPISLTLSSPEATADLAARLGARRVIALEPSDLWTDARELVAENGLEHIVTVLPIPIGDLTADRLPDNWQGADLIFSELLNADPLAEGIVSASAAARELLADNGVLAPHQLDLHLALAHTEAHRDLSGAQRQLDLLADRFDLDLTSAAEVLEAAEIEPFVSPAARLVSEVRTVATVDLLQGGPPPERCTASFQARQEATGAALWWTAHYGPNLRMTNAPGTINHWGQLVCAWPRPVPAGPVTVVVELEDDTARLLPADDTGR